MSTSANVIEYTIYKNGDNVGSFRKHILCRLPDYADLLEHQPLKEHEILDWGYDEEDEYWEGDPQNLEEFLKGMVRFNKKIKEYFDGR
jgi:hypothetical protein